MGRAKRRPVEDTLDKHVREAMDNYPTSAMVTMQQGLRKFGYTIQTASPDLTWNGRYAAGTTAATVATIMKTYGGYQVVISEGEGNFYIGATKGPSL